MILISCLNKQQPEKRYKGLQKKKSEDYPLFVATKA